MSQPTNPPPPPPPPPPSNPPTRGPSHPPDNRPPSRPPRRDGMAAAVDDIHASLARLEAPARQGVSGVVHASGGPVKTTRFAAGEGPTPGPAVAVAAAARGSNGGLTAARAGAQLSSSRKGSASGPVSVDHRPGAGPAGFTLPVAPRFSMRDHGEGLYGQVSR